MKRLELLILFLFAGVSIAFAQNNNFNFQFNPNQPIPAITKNSGFFEVYIPAGQTLWITMDDGQTNTTVGSIPTGSKNPSYLRAEMSVQTGDPLSLGLGNPFVAGILNPPPPPPPPDPGMNAVGNSIP